MGLINAWRDLRTIKLLRSRAEEEARRAGDELPGPEHLLLAALSLPDGTAARALARLGADPDSLRSAISATHASVLQALGVPVEADGVAERTSEHPLPARGVFESTAPAQQVFQTAVALSKSVKPARLLGAHVVAAVCEQERGTAVRALRKLGIDRGALRAAAREEAGRPR